MINVRKRGKVYEYRIEVASIDGKRKWLSKSGFKTKQDALKDLRGSFATKALNNGTKIKDVADLLGHKNVETTENYYISSTERDKMNVVISFDKNRNDF